MSKAASSPTARLLQSSRLFSLPRPLPPAPLEALTAGGKFRASDTATAPYPTHQAIATTPTSLARGDWGLKRALPAKATRHQTTPHVRIEAQDTPEHITDFASASDHTQTVQKWLEMGVPIVKKQPTRTSYSNANRKPPTTVYSADDSTDPANPSASRWKFDSPWIAGMQSGEFETYLEKVVGGKKKKAAWKTFLAEAMVEDRLATKRREAQNNGQPLSWAAAEEMRPSLWPTAEEIDKFQKELRDNHAVDNLSSELTRLISSFLDAPGLTSTVVANPGKTQDMFNLLNDLDTDDQFADSAPPSTHPAAGLSHLQTNAIMENHPLYGPQAHRAPVLSRVVRPRSGAGSKEHVAKLGVGGIVTNDPISSNATSGFGPRPGQQKYDPDYMANQIDIDLAGGNKMWVHPRTATIDEKGRIRLEVTRANNEAIAVKTGNVQHIHEQRAAADRPMSSPRMPLPGTPGNAKFGFSLPDRRQPMRSQPRPSRPSFKEESESEKRFRELMDKGGKQ